MEVKGLGSMVKKDWKRDWGGIGKTFLSFLGSFSCTVRDICPWKYDVTVQDRKSSLLPLDFQ
jgi:hypothetical protein